MRKALILVGALAALVALAAPPTSFSHLTSEKCFLASDAGQVIRDSVSRAVELQNNGSTSIWCALMNQADAVVSHSREIKPAGGTWALDVPAAVGLWCIAATVDQQSLQS